MATPALVPPTGAQEGGVLGRTVGRIIPTGFLPPLALTPTQLVAQMLGAIVSHRSRGRAAVSLTTLHTWVFEVTPAERTERACHIHTRVFCVCNTFCCHNIRKCIELTQLRLPSDPLKAVLEALFTTISHVSLEN